jgi:predicted site-specific integrase-resolvase
MSLPRQSAVDEDLSGLLLTVPAVAEIAGVARVTLWRMVKDGRLTPDFSTDQGEALFHPHNIVDRVTYAQTRATS